MNKHLYRIIFNSARGMLMVVAEIARSGRPRTARRRSPLCGAEVQVRLSPLSLLLWLALVTQGQRLHNPAQGQDCSCSKGCFSTSSRVNWLISSCLASKRLSPTAWVFDTYS